MTNINVDKKFLLKQIGQNLTDAELRDKISMMGTDPEEITGNELVVEIFPNRPDLLSGYSITKAFKSFLGKKTGLKKYKINSAQKDFEVIIDKSVNKVRPYTACAIIKNLELNELKIKEIIQLQEKLHLTFGRNRKKLAIGIYPLEKIKLPIYFKADKPEKIKFIPLESNREMTGKEILRRHPTGIKYSKLLANKEKYPYFEDANKEILSMPPIINSELTGRVTEKTKNVFIECSGFDYSTLEKCLNIIVTIFADMGGKIYQMDLKYPDKTVKSPLLKNEKMLLNLDYINKILGTDLTLIQAKTSLEKMGHAVEIINKKLKVTSPCYRADILHKIDLVEDLAIGYGYNNFKEEIPKVATIAEENKIEKLKNKLREILTNLGMIEVKNYEIVNSENQTKKIKNKKIPIKLLSSISTEFDSLRTNLLINLLNTLNFNLKNDNAENIFELGTIFQKDKTQETNIKEQENLAIIISNPEANFTKIKQTLTTLMHKLAQKYTLKETKEDHLIQGRSGEILINNKKIGEIGEIHPEIVLNFDLKNPCAYLEINLNKLLININ